MLEHTDVDDHVDSANDDAGHIQTCGHWSSDWTYWSMLGGLGKTFRSVYGSVSNDGLTATAIRIRSAGYMPWTQCISTDSWWRRYIWGLLCHLGKTLQELRGQSREPGRIKCTDISIQFFATCEVYWLHHDLSINWQTDSKERTSRDGWQLTSGYKPCFKLDLNLAHGHWVLVAICFSLMNRQVVQHVGQDMTVSPLRRCSCCLLYWHDSCSKTAGSHVSGFLVTEEVRSLSQRDLYPADLPFTLLSFSQSQVFLNHPTHCRRSIYIYLLTSFNIST